MRKPTEAEVLQASAIIVAAPRYMGAFAEAIGISILTYWPRFATIEIVSGAAMAVLEGWAIAFMFRKWRTMPALTAHWWVLLVLQLLLMLALPATATPYLLASQLGKPANELMPVALLVAWSFVVAAIAPLVLAAVGYADVESGQPAGRVGEASESKFAQVLPEPAPAPTLPALELPEPEPAPALPAPVGVACPDCTAPFATKQALAAHKRFCPALVSVNGNGHKPAL